MKQSEQQPKQLQREDLIVRSSSTNMNSIQTNDEETTSLSQVKQEQHPMPYDDEDNNDKLAAYERASDDADEDDEDENEHKSAEEGALGVDEAPSQEASPPKEAVRASARCCACRRVASTESLTDLGAYYSLSTVLFFAPVVDSSPLFTHI